MMNFRSARSYDTVEAAARHELLRLVVAVGADDYEAAAIASFHLKRALASANELVGNAACDERGRFDALRELGQRWIASRPRPQMTLDPALEPAHARLTAGFGVVARICQRYRAMFEGREPPLRADDLRFSELDLDELLLEGVSMARANLTGVTARRATLTGANLTSAQLTQCDLRGITLTQATLHGSVLERCDLDQADLEGSILVGMKATLCRFREARLIDAWLDGAVFEDCDLRGATLQVTRAARIPGTPGLRFVRCDLRHANLSGRDPGAVFSDCALDDADTTAVKNAHGFARTDPSPGGDRSQIGSGSEVMGALSRGRADHR